MNEQLRDALNKFRGTQLHGPEELAEFIKNEGVQFSGDDLSTWGWFLTSRFGRHGGVFQVPEWLAGIFRELSKEASPETICDPWAGIGLLIGILGAAPQVKESFAFTQNNSEFVLGKILVPDANWKLGEPLELLSAMNKEVDVVASILPMNARSPRPLTISGSSGDKLELRDSLGDLLLVAASTKLAASVSACSWSLHRFSFPTDRCYAISVCSDWEWKQHWHCHRGHSLHTRTFPLI